MTKAGQCTPTSTAQCLAIGRARGTPSISYGAAAVLRVTSINRNDQTICFEARNLDGVRTTFSDVPWAKIGTMWPCCPTTLASDCDTPAEDDRANRGFFPAVNSRGTLYFEQQFALRADLEIETPKVPGTANLLSPPEPLASAGFRRITVVPSRLILEGWAADSRRGAISVDLLDMTMVERRQSITIDPLGVQINATRKAFTAYKEPFPTGQFDPEVELEAAITFLLDKPSDPIETARALALVATTVAEMGDEVLAGDVTDWKLTQVNRLLKGFVPPALPSMSPPPEAGDATSTRVTG
jgi:hypothetical protein